MKFKVTKTSTRGSWDSITFKALKELINWVDSKGEVIISVANHEPYLEIYDDYRE